MSAPVFLVGCCRSPGKPLHHEADHSNGNPGFLAAGQHLIIFGEPTPGGELGEGSLHNPTPFEDMEAAGSDFSSAPAPAAPCGSAPTSHRCATCGNSSTPSTTGGNRGATLATGIRCDQCRNWHFHLATLAGRSRADQSMLQPFCAGDRRETGRAGAHGLPGCAGDRYPDVKSRLIR